jgi:phospholipid/cholesterol/gamma-HCH transport system substrate-binding protein
LDTGKGYAARFLHDEAEAARVSKVIGNLEQTTARLNGVIDEVDKVVGRVNTGPGLAHEVVYGESGSRAIAQIGAAADEVGQVLRGVREGSGLARGLLFGNGADEAVAGDVSAMSSDLRAMVSDLRQGKGTLGALLVDPSVYEDLKLLLGNIQRNQALRALVRYSIKRDDGLPQVEVVDPAPGEQPSTSSAKR